VLEITLGVALFTGIVLLLSLVILAVRSKLVASGSVNILVNGERKFATEVGEKLLGALSSHDLFLPSACGGKGTCGQCRAVVVKGGGAILPTETASISKRDAANHVRLACQVAVKRDMVVNVPDEVFGVKQWQCTVRSNRNVATFIKEIVLELPPGESMEFRAGGYVQVECPPYETRFADFQVEPAFRTDWDRYNLWRYESKSDRTTTRAYSMANYPAENDIIMLNVRIATPPPAADETIPPGIVSSYLFSRDSGDTVTVFGPYGHFFAKDTDSEMIFIGGGAGMAPMRSHILDQLLRIHTRRRMTFWYGARSMRELFYADDFESLQAEHDNFRWFVALSDPQPEDEWTGLTGFIHQVVYDQYLEDHPAPEDCEYYLCGPPMMNAAVIKMLEDLGVESENILLDDFGA